jgi:1,2-phenylacetyl-CoA epoxidase catalytic subunit
LREATVDGNEFVNKLKAENEAILAKIDEPPLSSGVTNGGISSGGIPNGEMLATLIKMALKNEIEAAEIAAEWVSTTPELHAKLALARHAGDEARHYQLIEEKARALGISLDGFRPLDPPSPVLKYLRTLTTTPERIAAALVAREAMGGRRNVQFLAFLDRIGQRDLAALYRDVINPDEDLHHRSGCAVLAELASAPEAQQAARRAALGLLETGDRVRSNALQTTGAPVIPGC